MQTSGGRTGARDVTLPIECIAHLNDDEHRQRARLGLGGGECVAVDARKHPRFSRALHVMRLTTGIVRQSVSQSVARSYSRINAT